VSESNSAGGIHPSERRAPRRSTRATSSRLCGSRSAGDRAAPTCDGRRAGARPRFHPRRRSRRAAAARFFPAASADASTPRSRPRRAPAPGAWVAGATIPGAAGCTDVARAVPHPREPLDERGHARQRPQFRGEPMGSGSLKQRRFDPRELRRLEPRLAPRTAGCLQRLAALVLPGVIPAMGRRPRRAKRASNGRLRFAAREQPRGLVPTRFQRSKIPSGSAVGGWHCLASQGTR
jgi:hypothetical protein